MDWRFKKKNVAGFGLAGGGAPRTRALLLSCAVRSAAPGGPARPPARSLLRPRSLLPPPPPPLHGRARPAPPPRPLAARPPASPASAGVGSGPCACLPRPLPSPGVLLKGRGGRARAGEGGGSQRPRGRARRGPPPSELPRRGARAPTRTAQRAGGRLPRFEPGEAQPVTNERPLSLALPLSVNFGECRSMGGSGALVKGEGKQLVEVARGPLAGPPAPPAPQRPRGPEAPALRSQPRRLGCRGDHRGLGAGSRAQHCRYLTQQEQCWGNRGAPRREM